MLDVLCCFGALGVVGLTVMYIAYRRKSEQYLQDLTEDGVIR